MKHVFKSLFLVIGVLATAFSVGTVSAAEPSEADFNRYSELYCVDVKHSYQMLQEGYDMPAKRARIIRSEMKRCKEVRTAYLKIHPPGTIRTTIASHPGFR